jgi:peptide deformylase
MLFNKVKNLGSICSNLHEFRQRQMAKLKILEFPDPRLRKKALPVEVVDDALRRLIEDMFETMYDAPGIGLAATQVDVHRRLLVADVSTEKDAPIALINPEILQKDGAAFTEEGCLSVPGYYEEVERAEHIRVRYLDRDGKACEEDFEELLAVCVQHEIDHLDGKLFVDYLSEAKRQRIRKRLEKDRRNQRESTAAIL